MSPRAIVAAAAGLIVAGTAFVLMSEPEPETGPVLLTSFVLGLSLSVYALALGKD